MKTKLKYPLAGSIALVSFACVLSFPNSLFALGIMVPDQDAFATARGNAFVATADDPAAVYYNPAGISQLDGGHLSLGAYGVVIQDSYHGISGNLNSQTELAVLPQIFSTWSLPKYNLTLGLGGYNPYGLRMEWPDNSGLAAVGQTGEVDYYTLNPVIAYQIIPTLSIAAGPTLNFSEADLKFNPGFINHFRGRDTAAGFNAGILWHPWEQHSFGLTYRSATDMHYQGHGTALPPVGNIPSSVNFHFPQSVAFGYSFRPTSKWNFEADATWTDWSQLQNLTLSPQGPLDTVPFHWHPSWMFDFGATRYLGNGWKLSGGYMYSMNTVPDNTYNPLVPDSDRHIFSIGVGKQYNKISWDVAYQFGWGPTRSIGNDAAVPADGSYEFFSHAITFNVGYHF